MMKKTLLRFAGSALLFASACAAPGSSAEIDEQDFPVSKYEDVFADSPDNDTLPIDSKADEVLPKKHDELVTLQSPVRNQASRGVCTIFSSIGLMEALYIKAGMPNPDFSEQYLQWATKVLDRQFTSTGGSSNPVNINTVTKRGIVDEVTYPYETSPWGASNDPACVGEEDNWPVKCHTNGDPSEAVKAAKKYKLPQGQYLNTRSIKSHINTTKTPVVVGLDFFYQAWNHGGSKLPLESSSMGLGIVRYPNDADKTDSRLRRAGHGILIVGWDDNKEVQKIDQDGKLVVDAAGKPVMEKGFYIFKNSWGTNRFGVNNTEYGPGFGFISQQYVSEFANAYVTGVPSLDEDPVMPPSGMDVTKSYDNATETAIPDNNATGISSLIDVADKGALRTLEVTVDITHPWVGDLSLKLAHGTKTVTLQSRQGGSSKNLKKTFTVTGFGDKELKGEWKLVVVDNERQDAGKLNSWSMKAKFASQP